MKYRIHYRTGFIGDPIDWYVLLWVLKMRRIDGTLHHVTKVSHATR